jgi:hypothetical protein
MAKWLIGRPVRHAEVLALRVTATDSNGASLALPGRLLTRSSAVVLGPPGRAHGHPRQEPSRPWVRSPFFAGGEVGVVEAELGRFDPLAVFAGGPDPLRIDGGVVWLPFFFCCRLPARVGKINCASMAELSRCCVVASAPCSLWARSTAHRRRSCLDGLPRRRLAIRCRARSAADHPTPFHCPDTCFPNSLTTRT